MTVFWTLPVLWILPLSFGFVCLHGLITWFWPLLVSTHCKPCIFLTYSIYIYHLGLHFTSSLSLSAFGSYPFGDTKYDVCEWRKSQVKLICIVWYHIWSLSELLNLYKEIPDSFSVWWFLNFIHSVAKFKLKPPNINKFGRLTKLSIHHQRCG